jgi:putative transposase
MARLARLVIPGLPHHVTQRGNGRAQTFFEDTDYALYRDLLGRSCREANVAVWAWVLMPNHVHLILTPSDEDGLRRALAPVHRRYAGHVHARERRTGHFWQGRFGTVVMDEAHLCAALAYIAQNPVRARLVKHAADWPWSSVHAHLSGQPDGLTTLEPVRGRYPRFSDLIDAGADEPAFDRLRRAETIGRPLGDDTFVAALETQTQRPLRPAKREPKARAQAETSVDIFSALSP